MSSPQSRRGSSRTAPPDQSSQADRPSRKSPQAACPHQKNRIDPSYPHPRILLRQLDSHKFRKAAIFRGALKALAEQTAKATGEIGQQISGIQAATQESVNAIKEISGTIEKLSEISSTIAAAVEEQGAATQEISRNVQQAAQGTVQVSSH